MSQDYDPDEEERPERICSNCNSFYPESPDLTGYGICLADEAFAPYIDELIEHNNFSICQALIQEKRFHGGRDVCPDYDEAEFAECSDSELMEIIHRLAVKKISERPKPPEHSFEDHSFAWLLQHDERLKALHRKYQQHPAEERRMAADFEYHAFPAQQLFDQAVGDTPSPYPIPGEVVALAMDPEYAPAILTVGTHEHILGRTREAMELLLSLPSLPRDTEDLLIIIEKAERFLIDREDHENAKQLYEAAAARFPDEPMFREGAASRAGKGKDID